MKVYKNILAFICIIASSIIFNSATAHAETYYTAKSGDWTDKSTWFRYNIAPSNINYDDVVYISHNVNAGKLKINNKGTIIINDTIVIDELTLNGPNSRLYVADESYLITKTIKGNVENIYYYKSSQPKPLPVTWLSFNVASTRNGNSLTWSTAMEENNNYFAVERSADGFLFEEIFRTEGTNTNQPHSYNFIDTRPLPGTSYYRIRQEDYDGTGSYTPVRAVNNVALTFTQLGNTLYFSNKLQGQIQLYTAGASLVFSGNLLQTDELKLPELQSDVYILHFQNNTGDTLQTKFLVNRKP
ncbi:MAG: hypothetical protein LPJ89_09960 [Hymenobacteraceae bacterium]|nr:hypothetical protein [Hymenobacteraceae bacterium]